MELQVGPELLMSYIYRRTFDNADSYLFLFPARCINTE